MEANQFFFKLSKFKPPNDKSLGKAWTAKIKKNKFSKNREHMIFRLCFYYVVCIRYYLDHRKKVLGCA